MDAIVDGLKSIVKFFNVVLDFILDLVQGFIDGMTLLAKSITEATVLAGYMPTFIFTAFTVFLSIYVIKFIMGR